MTSSIFQQNQSLDDCQDNVIRVIARTADTSDGNDSNCGKDTRVGGACEAHLYWRGQKMRCVLGGAGIIPTSLKKEGDNATPAGLFGLDTLYFRADRLKKPQTRLPSETITKKLSWCDHPSAQYNQPIDLPTEAHAEDMWRDDHVYDLVISLTHNRNPARPGAGSAIFIHIARDNFSPTHGCVALAKSDLLELLTEIGPETMIRIYV